ncbi:hypothetical protein [Rhizobium sp. NLR22b]|uniref:hypothetical protein n=1 Tax=Rhizobium sp. NLR22b TaxID=2731115 RepID=UPI001C838607|nr:hypothetical protein [Rhizobium sp. NLR22b]MBX5240977.1 hypothetical protein [Rhizobium sp. NLR22b]
MLGLSLSLSLGNPALNQGHRQPTVEIVLQDALAARRFVTATYEGEELRFAPLVVYQSDDVVYVEMVLMGDFPAHGSRPPAITSLEKAMLANAYVTEEGFEVSPSLQRILGRYQNVEAIVSF